MNDIIELSFSKGRFVLASIVILLATGIVLMVVSVSMISLFFAMLLFLLFFVGNMIKSKRLR
ncbi:MAG: hypothetical protein LC643_05835, partial [Bacteroidales bacterium]|nr:hypothetical protein [Bacteroidales bacterium]